jgi:hypothetical protein
MFHIALPGHRDSALDAMRVGTTEGMQHFDGEIEGLIGDGTVDFETGMAYATDPGKSALGAGGLRIANRGTSHPPGNLRRAILGISALRM